MHFARSFRIERRLRLLPLRESGRQRRSCQVLLLGTLLGQSREKVYLPLWRTETLHPFRQEHKSQWQAERAVLYLLVCCGQKCQNPLCRCHLLRLFLDMRR